MPFNIGGPELLLIAVIALIAFGPGQLPEVMRGAARTWRNFRRATEGLRGELTRTMAELNLEDAQRPAGYDPTTHSVPYVEPTVPERINVGNYAHLPTIEPLEPGPASTTAATEGEQLGFDRLWGAATNGQNPAQGPVVPGQDRP
ncbi:MAG TPA: twin-arginine translocase TatA/TatE family subunit [bacterium]|nr:twin-arginine translocase TatA/TatE family subunit [bacterium]